MLHAGCPTATANAVQTTLRNTDRLYVLGFSTTGGGHERLAGIVGHMEKLLLKDAKAAAVSTCGGKPARLNVTVLVSMPEPWRGNLQPSSKGPATSSEEQNDEMDHSVFGGGRFRQPQLLKERLDHTGSVLSKVKNALLSAVEDVREVSLSILCITAAKTVTGFYRSDGSAPAWDLIHDMAIVRPSRKAVKPAGAIVEDELCLPIFAPLDLVGGLPAGNPRRPQSADSSGMDSGLLQRGSCAPSASSGAPPPEESRPSSPHRSASEAGGDDVKPARMHMEYSCFLLFDNEDIREGKTDLSKLSYKDVARGCIPSAQKLLDFVTWHLLVGRRSSVPSSRQVFVVTDMDPDLTSAGMNLALQLRIHKQHILDAEESEAVLKSKAAILKSPSMANVRTVLQDGADHVSNMHTQRDCNSIDVRCLDYENHQDLALANFGLYSNRDLDILEANLSTLTVVLRDASLKNAVYECVDEARDMYLERLNPALEMTTASCSLKTSTSWREKADAAIRRTPLSMTLSLEFDKLVSPEAAAKFVLKGSEYSRLLPRMPPALRTALWRDGYQMPEEYLKADLGPTVNKKQDLQCLCTMERVRRSLIKAVFLLKVLNMSGKNPSMKESLLRFAHVDIVDPGFRRFSEQDVNLYGKFASVREDSHMNIGNVSGPRHPNYLAIRFLVEWGFDLSAVPNGEVRAGVLYAREEGEEESSESIASRIEQIIYVYAHSSSVSFLDYFRARMVPPGEKRPGFEKLLIVVCGKSWHKPLDVREPRGDRAQKRLRLADGTAAQNPGTSIDTASTQSAAVVVNGFNISDPAFVRQHGNVMRIAQFARGHAVITAGAGACGEYSDLNYTFRFRSDRADTSDDVVAAPQCFLLPLKGQKEQFFNGVIMERALGHDLVVCNDIQSAAAWDELFEGRFLARVLRAENFEKPVLGRAGGVASLLRKPSAEQHAAELLHAEGTQQCVDLEQLRTEKERIIHELQRVLVRTGTHAYLRTLRRRFKRFYQVSEGLRMLVGKLRERSGPDASEELESKKARVTFNVVPTASTAVAGVMGFAHGGDAKRTGDASDMRDESKSCVLTLPEALQVARELAPELRLLGVDSELVREFEALDAVATPLVQMSAVLDAVVRRSSELFLTGF